MIWIGLAFLLAGLGLLALMVVLVINDSVFFASVLLMIGCLMTYGGFQMIKGAAANLKKQLEEEKAEGVKTTRKSITKHIVVTVAVLLVVALGFVGYAGFEGARYVNSSAEMCLTGDFTEYSLANLERLEAEVAQMSPVEKLFFLYEEEMQDYRARYFENVEQRAREITAAIDGLVPCTQIESNSHYRQLLDAVEALELDDRDDYEASILSRVDNYDKLEAYLQQVEAVRDTYKHTCTDCEGRGYFTCTRCGGSGGGSCSSCDGKGKKVVTWYSNGDWGEVSYSSYDCSSCNGRGRYDCSSCSNGRDDCSCEDGNVYIYENP